MPGTRKRKRPITAPSLPTPSASSTHTRALIRQYHVLLKSHARLSSSTPSEDAEKRKREVEEEMRKLGGLETYQAMSAIGQGKERGGGSERVLVGWMREMGIHNRSQPLKLLEVGALKSDNYASCSSWIECTPIDLHSRHPAIKEQDFLKMDVQVNAGRWDCISLSLVLNFVGVPADRGRMLSLAHTFLVPSPTSYLFLVLPLPCILNSRFLTPDYLVSLMSAIGFELVKERWKERSGKVAYWLWRRVERPAQGKDGGKWGKKTLMREGGGRNNFAVLWDGR